VTTVGSPPSGYCMRVEEIMTRNAVTVTPETTLKEVAALLVAKKISGVPVCEADGRVVGVVSAADIIWKELGAADVGLLERVLDTAYGDSSRLDARTAGDAMSMPAITIAPGADVSAAAKAMVDHGVNRLPVLDHGRLVGIVTRADLLRAFQRSDEEIEREISEDVLLHTLWIDPDSVALVVNEGEITIGGLVENRSTAELVRSYIRRVPGVVAVHSTLAWNVDDLARRTAASANRISRRV